MTQQQQNKTRYVGKLAFAAVMMFGFGFALIPLYTVFCEITGLNGKTGQVSAADAGNVDESREISVVFISNVKTGSSWDFYPTQRKMKVHPGKIYEATYVAKNKAGNGVTGQAVPSVTPGVASIYFNKTECFCFTEQYFEAGEQREMPLRFIVDPKLPAEVTNLTLSYTFFNLKEGKVENKG